MRWNVECAECGKKETFGDAKDITHAHWTILAWIVPSGEPRCVCDECEYGKPKKAKKRESKSDSAERVPSPEGAVSPL